MLYMLVDSEVFLLLVSLFELLQLGYSCVEWLRCG